MARPTEMTIILITVSLVEPRGDLDLDKVKRVFITHESPGANILVAKAYRLALLFVNNTVGNV